MATIDLGRLGFVNKGTYNNSTTYEKNDLVQFTDGGILSTYLYIDSSAQSGQAPSSSGTAGSRWVYFAKGVADAVASAGNNKVLVTNASGNLTPLAIGSAGQVLKTNSSANGFEFGTDAGGGLVKVTTYENSTRTVLSGSTNGTIFNNITITKVKDATTSKIIAIGFSPGEMYNSYHSGLYFVCTTTGMDNSGTNNSSAFSGIGQSYGYDTNAPGMLHVNKTFQDTTNLGSGSHTFKIGWKSRDGASEQPADIINPNTTDDGRAHQTGTFIQLMEVLI